jgi:uncharacterized protein
VKRRLLAALSIASLGTTLATAQTVAPTPMPPPAAPSATTRTGAAGAAGTLPPATSPATPEKSPAPSGAAAAVPAVSALRVVLLLPLDHPLLKRAAASVREGVTAVFATRKGDVNLRECSYGAEPSGDVLAAYARCVDDTVDWVIGPLGRNDVAALAQAKLALPRPTLLLSPLGAMPPTPMAVLAPELEAEGEAIAKQALEDACRYPVLVDAGGGIAGRVVNAIMNYWRELRVATLLPQKTLGSRDNWRRDVDRWRRDNVDCVLFAGGGSQLAELRPFLRNMAIYVTSASYEASLERTADWTGVRIADAPWLIEPDRAEFAPYLPVVPADSSSPTLGRLYALGVDAARLAIAAGRDALPPTFDGAIGQLTLKDAHYRRQPMMGEFRERNLVKVGP